MATMNATVDGWRNRQTATWFPSSGFASIGSSTGASLYIASNPSGNNKYTICLRVKTPSSTSIGSISKLSVSFKVYKANSNAGTLYGSLRTTYTDSGSSDTASTFRNNAIGSEVSSTYSSTSYGTITFEFSGTFSQGTYYYLFLYTKSNSDMYYTTAGNLSPSAVATYSVKTYAVTYNANGGTGAPSTQYKTHGTALTLSSTKPTKASTSPGNYTVTLNANGGTCSSASLTAKRTTSYTFSTWNTNSSGTGTSYASGASYTTNAALSLYAIYSSSTTTASVTLPTPTRDGYDFMGWATSSSATSGSTGSYKPSGNVTLYAIWGAKGLVYIGNEAYQIYIGNGSSWDLYAPYVGNGTDWDLCS
ncbi:MAG: InlB B-repeat-containing protein [Oscillospiraceae bacterium]|nr:InlB B-repeat-containing protein [Oscillospiraceae bacterium]